MCRGYGATSNNPIIKLASPHGAPSLIVRSTSASFARRRLSASSAAMDEAHLVSALRYVALNPVRAGLVERAED